MANRLTRVIGGNGTQTQSFTLDPGLLQYVQSVLVQLSNGAAVAVRPTLSVKTNNGVVIAAKRQGESIPAGDTGTATWALRLDDERAATTSTGAQLDYVERTTSLTSTTALANFIVGNAVTYDGATRIKVEVFAPEFASNNVAFTGYDVRLYEGSTNLGILASMVTQGNALGNYSVLYGARFFTPSAGSHTYTIKAQGVNAGGGGIIVCGPGGAGFYLPAFYRITTA